MIEAGEPHLPQLSFRRGLRLGIPFGLVAFVIAVSIAVIARDLGFSMVGTIVFAVALNAGAAQLSALAVLAGGGGAVAATAAAGLMNSRYLPMGVALASSLPGPPWVRFLWGQTLVDPSWALASRGDGTFDRWLMLGSWLPQFSLFLTGTTVGALAGETIGDTGRIGLDAVAPMFFVALLLGELRSRGRIAVAAAAGVVAFALIPISPAGGPILAASFLALTGLRRGAGS